MRQVIQSSVKAGEGITRTAERLLDADLPKVNLPRYVQELREAAAIGDGKVYRGAVKTWQRQIEGLGQGPLKEAGEYTVRSASRQLVRDLAKAKVENVDKIVDRWILEKARYQARVVARNESVEAFREMAIKQAQDQPWTVGVRWTLSPSHPRKDVCFPAGTMVQTLNGPRAIESVSIGEEVLTHRGRWRKVVRLYRTTPDEALLRLRFRAGTSQVHEVVTTPNHPFATGKGWTRADALRVGSECYALVACPTKPSCPRCGGTTGTFQSGSLQSSPCEHRESCASAQCAELPLTAHRTGNSETLLASSGQHMSDDETARSSRYRQSIAGCLPPCEPQTCERAFHQASTTYQDDDSQSSDFQSRLGPCPCTLSNSKLRVLEADRLASHTSCMGECDKRPSRISDGACEEENRSCILRTRASGAAPSQASQCGETTPRIYENSGLGERLRDHPQSQAESDEFQQSTPGISSLPWVTESLLEGVLSIPSNGCEVFNLEVESDHSYFANGLMVHNCDVYASADSYGLGPGGYPADSVPARHPSCLCSMVSISDPNYLRREVSKAKGEPEPTKPWLTGVKESPEQWLRKQPADTQKAIVGPTRAKLVNDGRKILDTGASNFRPVYRLQQKPKPVRDMGPKVDATEIVRRDRENQVMPFPRLKRQ